MTAAVGCWYEHPALRPRLQAARLHGQLHPEAGVRRRQLPHRGAAQGAAPAGIGFTVGRRRSCHDRPRASLPDHGLLCHVRGGAPRGRGHGHAPARVTAFPARTRTVGYYIAADGRIRHMRYQVQVTQQGHGVRFITDPADLLDPSVHFSGNGGIKGAIVREPGQYAIFPERHLPLRSAGGRQGGGRDDIHHRRAVGREGLDGAGAHELRGGRDATE